MFVIFDYRLENKPCYECLNENGLQKLKIALIQTNPVIGDFSRNCSEIINWTDKAHKKGCDLVIFPEMSIAGYPPQDLLERRSFLKDQDREASDMIGQLPDIHVLFGRFEQRLSGKGKPLYNSAVVVRNGQVIHRTRKQLLPTYDVFDEKRYFDPGPRSELFEMDGLTLAITVCEDIWYDEIDEYAIEPVQHLFMLAAEKGKEIDAIINISASPFQRGKLATRKKIMSRICRRFNVPLLYVNQVGGQDSLLFDGSSLVMDKTGEITAMGREFEEDMIVVDSATWKGEKHSDASPDELSSIHNALVMGVRDYASKCGFSSAVLGLSGGIDSALTAVLGCRALGPENVLCVALPSPYSSGESLEDAAQLARHLGCQFEIIPIHDLFEMFSSVLKPLFKGRKEDLTEQNIQARIRGNLLMALSNKFGHLLLTTGNKSEMAVGYCTLYGDMSGGLAVISDVPKLLVYELSRFANREKEIIPERIITKAPSAELKPDQRDQDDLPPYEVLDQILELYLEKGFSLQEIVDSGFDRDIVQDVVKRIRINEYKRKQAPMGLKVTSKAFGYGRRYPNAQNYRE